MTTFSTISFIIVIFLVGFLISPLENNIDDEDERHF
jgi:hypothetical protein